MRRGFGLRLLGCRSPKTGLSMDVPEEDDVIDVVHGLRVAVESGSYLRPSGYTRLPNHANGVWTCFATIQQLSLILKSVSLLGVRAFRLRTGRWSNAPSVYPVFLCGIGGNRWRLSRVVMAEERKTRVDGDCRWCRLVLVWSDRHSPGVLVIRKSLCSVRWRFYRNVRGLGMGGCEGRTQFSRMGRSGAMPHRRHGHVIRVEVDKTVVHPKCNVGNLDEVVEAITYEGKSDFAQGSVLDIL